MKQHLIILLLTAGLLLSACAAGGEEGHAAYAPEEWAAATMALRSRPHPYHYLFEDAGLLGLVEAAEGDRLTLHTIYRSQDEAGNPLPQVMLPEEDEDAVPVTLSVDADLQVFRLAGDPEDCTLTPASGSQIPPGSVVSLWGQWQDGDFYSDALVVWSLSE